MSETANGNANDRRIRPQQVIATLSSGNRLFLLWPLIAIVLVLLALAAASMEIMSGARAYVGGESLWSKGQKEAVRHLLDYLEHGQPADYDAYRRHIAVTQGDRRAREALDRDPPDLAAAQQGFLDGGNDGADVPSLIRLFRWFRHAPPMREAITLWAEGDRLIADMDTVARLAHERMRQQGLAAPEAAALTARVKALNAELEPVAVRFSWTLGRISRQIHGALHSAMIIASGLSLLVGVLLTRRMLRESQQVELDLRSSEASLREAQRLARVGSWSFLPDGGRTLWSDEARRILGGGPTAELPDWSRYLNRIPDGDRGRIEAAWKAALGEGRAYEAEYRIDVPGRGCCWIHERGNPVLDDGRIVRIDGTVMDVTERRSAEERVRQLAHYDELTGLPNRTLFHQELQRALEAAHALDTRLALMFIDLDRFKFINDTLGHDAGDLVLVETARRLGRSLRELDIVARLGGDEFVVLIEGLESGTEAAAVAQKVLDQVGRPIRIDDRDYSVTASIGISVFPTDGDDPLTLRKNADLAMYRAKEKGKNQYEFYSVYMSRRSSRQFALESDLRGALERGELLLHYQPRVRPDRTGRLQLAGCEALLRWQHPERGLIAPAHFVGIAEDTGLIVPIGCWVLETACRQAVIWAGGGHAPLRMSVNVSPRQLADRAFPALVHEALLSSGLDAGRLELEITESLLMDHPERSIRTLQALGALGTTLAVDDFGTGYSSLAYLRRLPIKCIKLDRSFVADLPHDAEACSIAHAVLALGHSLQREVVAEGVESPAQRDFLLQNGCDELQGFLFGAPVPAADFVRLHLSAAADG